jgi:hypothetical protein
VPGSSSESDLTFAVCPASSVSSMTPPSTVKECAEGSSFTIVMPFEALTVRHVTS